MKAKLSELTDAYLDGSITEPEMRRLNELLSADVEARRDFAEMLNVDSALAAMSADCIAESNVVKPSQTTKWRTATVCRIAAAASIALLLGSWWWQESQRAYATVESAAGAVEMVHGAALRDEAHVIKAGSVALITSRGARLVIEAPAEFRFESSQRLHLKRGRLAADVPPPAKGFTVITPSGDAVDLGTRFGVDVPATGSAEVHVFQGEVIAKAKGASAKQSLKDGDAVSLDSGAPTPRGLRSSAFIQSAEMSELSAGLDAGQRRRAEEALSALRRDPALIALLDFEDAEPLPGTFRMVQGRWPGSQAPEFVREGDHLKLDVGSDRAWPQLTLAAWVRIDQLGAPYQSLLHTDGWSKNNPGQVHWMITQTSTMRLALIGNVLAPEAHELQGHPDSLTPVLPEQGRWVHLVTVYDSQGGTVRFYLNGQFDKEVRQTTAHPARLGPAQIGNWNQQDRKLSGRVDELLLLGRAMQANEVQALYEAGNPYR
jgi:ferric-dicitrate binding protein FerR (iron transport regulator)